ncbi:hypothetical protein BDR06DRAFT_975675 [Suillus hirtellus]|nr:hypothetical protein BDR06DRAFT_975675 [Suillus hirtellus]
MQKSNSNVDSPVSATTGEPQKPLNETIVRENSGLEKVRKGVFYRQRPPVEERANTAQSNTSRKAFSWHLPTEILSEVFLYCLPQDEYLCPTPQAAPLLLTTICRRWREVAVGLPSLWCRLQMTAEHDNLEKRALCYNLWLKRSGGCPLSLRLECHTNWSELQSLLQPYIQQISSLKLDFFACDGPFVMEGLHALKELTIHKYGFDPKSTIDRSLSNLPLNLRKLDITSLLYSRKDLEFFTDSAWARLTHVEINVNGLDTFPRILHLCPNLSSVVMIGILDPIQTLEPVTHVNLQSLRMSGDVFLSSAGALGLFDVLTLPNLRVVEARNIGPWPHEEFKAFLMRSECPLESLIFGNAVHSTDQQREEYAALIPTLNLSVEPDSNFDMHEFLEDLGSEVDPTDQQQEDYVTLVPSFEFIIEPDSNFDIHQFLL